MKKSKDKRIKERYQCLMPVNLVLKDGVDGKKLAGPGKGSFCNISAGGAALIVEDLDFGEYHLVQTPLEDSEKFLELDVNDMVILSRPIWFHAITVDGENKFRVGVEFMKPPTEEELTEMVVVQGEDGKSGGWKKIVGKLFS